VGQPEDVVRRPKKPYMGTGRLAATDNYFTSPTLADSLLERQMFSSGLFDSSE